MIFHVRDNVLICKENHPSKIDIILTISLPRGRDLLFPWWRQGRAQAAGSHGLTRHRRRPGVWGQPTKNDQIRCSKLKSHPHGYCCKGGRGELDESVLGWCMEWGVSRQAGCRSRRRQTRSCGLTSAVAWTPQRRNRAFRRSTCCNWGRSWPTWPTRQKPLEVEYGCWRG